MTDELLLGTGLPLGGGGGLYIGEPLAHFDADQMAGNDGDAVTQWDDLTGPNHFTVPSGTGPPTLKKDIIGGRAVIRFDGVNDALQMPNPYPTSEGEVIAVLKTNTTNNQGHWRGDGGFEACHYPWGGQIYEAFGRSGRVSFAPGVTLTTAHVYSVRSAGGANGWQCRTNNVVRYQSSRSWSMTSPRLGHNWSGSWWSGDYAWVGFYPLLDDNERTTIIEALANHFGITL